MPKYPFDIIKIGDSAFIAGQDQHPNQLNFGYNFEPTPIGYKVTSEWDEERDVEGSQLKTRERRHVWAGFYYNLDGKKIAETIMSRDWEPIPDLAGLPTEFKAKAPEQLVKQQPFITMAVEKDINK